MEFAKSRGMVHWHGLCWQDDKEPHSLINKALQEGFLDDECAARLSDWASSDLVSLHLILLEKMHMEIQRKNFGLPQNALPLNHLKKKSTYKIIDGCKFITRVIT